MIDSSRKEVACTRTNNKCTVHEVAYDLDIDQCIFPMMTMIHAVGVVRVFGIRTDIYIYTSLTSHFCQSCCL